MKRSRSMLLVTATAVLIGIPVRATPAFGTLIDREDETTGATFAIAATEGICVTRDGVTECVP